MVADKAVTGGMEDARGGKVYFTDPYCSWWKGAIGNASKLVRRNTPKKPISMIFPTGKSWNTKENEQKTQRKNQLWLSPKTVSSTTFPDFALAAGLYNNCYT